MEGKYELSPEMHYAVRCDLLEDIGRFANLLQRNSGGISSNTPLDYKEIEQLRYVVKQVDMKVRLLGGWTS